MTSLEITKKAVQALDDKKAEDIQIIKVRDLTIVADYFVIASTSNATHVKALADEVEHALKEVGVEHRHIEGYSHANWVVLDYADVMVHIFQHETREYYNLGRLWSDGQELDVNTLLETE